MIKTYGFLDIDIQRHQGNCHMLGHLQSPGHNHYEFFSFFLTAKNKLPNIRAVRKNAQILWDLFSTLLYSKRRSNLKLFPKLDNADVKPSYPRQPDVLPNWLLPVFTATASTRKGSLFLFKLVAVKCFIQPVRVTLHRMT